MTGAAAKVFHNNWIENNPHHPMELVPSPRRVRVLFGGEVIADSTNMGLLREPKHVPVYYFPKEDVRMDLLTPTDHHSHCLWKGHGSYYTITAGGKIAENAAWTYADPYPQVPYFKDYIAFYWDRMDSWLEEDEEIFVHARDPFKRVDTCLSHREVRVMLAGEEIARTTEARFLFESNHQTRYYIPSDDIRMDMLEASPTRTSCPYKGDAIYYHARIDGKLIEDIAWSYPDPIAECPRIKGLICFFDERVDEILVEGKPVEKIETKWSR
ncbi:MAG: hypothetical protein ACI82H_000738 [Alphaproteobacteria bacterium]|jgi:uncharacterized protein (DUF427 family)